MINEQITVYVIRIKTKTLHPTITIGAVYDSEDKAKAEVERLNNANSYNSVTYCARQLDT